MDAMDQSLPQLVLRYITVTITAFFPLPGSAPAGRAWVGGSAEGWDGVWSWVDGTLMKELPWLYSQPGLQQGELLAVDGEAMFHTVGRRVALWPICMLKYE